MKKITLLATLLLFIFSARAQDVSVNEIIDSYLENTGGITNWKALKGIKLTGKLSQQGIELPIEVVRLADGRTYSKITFQGNELFLNVFDGETLWGVNFQTFKPEKSDTEATKNFKLNLNDFPDSFVDWEAKGYSAELIGKETIEGAETFKVKLVKEPLTIDGEEVEDVSFYYFDTEAMIPIAVDTQVRQGPQAGSTQRITQSDYDEVQGLYFPFSLTQGIKDGPSQPINFSEIIVNPEVDESLFSFSGGK